MPSNDGTDGATGNKGGIVGLLILIALLRSRDFDLDRLVDFLGALMLIDMRFSRSARSVSRSTTIGGACIRPFGILIGAGGLRLAGFGGLLVREGCEGREVGMPFAAAALVDAIAEIFKTFSSWRSTASSGSAISGLFYIQAPKFSKEGGVGKRVGSGLTGEMNLGDFSADTVV
jgi:hypothetical protein